MSCMTRQRIAIRSNQENRRPDRQKPHEIIYRPTESEASCRFGGAFFCVKMAGGGCDGHGTPCPYRACCKITGTDNKKHRARTKRTGAVGLVRLLQLSAAGEVFLEGTCPLSRCPQTAKFPAPYFWRTEKVGEKSDSFSRAERTRPLRPVCRLLCSDFGNIPVECFQRTSLC